jgi:hypothetical protein
LKQKPTSASTWIDKPPQTKEIEMQTKSITR